MDVRELRAGGLCENGGRKQPAVWIARGLGRVCPPFEQPGEAKHAVGAGVHVIRLLHAIGAHNPLVVARCRHKAAATDDRFLERRLLQNGFHARIDERCAFCRSLAPARNETPASGVQFAADLADRRTVLGLFESAVYNYGHEVGWSNVVGGFDLVDYLVCLKDCCNLTAGFGHDKASAHVGS